MIGIDILELDRVDVSEKFLDKIALKSEVDYIMKNKCIQGQKQRVASLFCVKEAVMKALEMGKNSGVVFKDIELSHEESGKPTIILHGKALEKYQKEFDGKKIEVSISHSETVATAICMII